MHNVGAGLRTGPSDGWFSKSFSIEIRNATLGFHPLDEFIPVFRFAVSQSRFAATPFKLSLPDAQLTHELLTTGVANLHGNPIISKHHLDVEVSYLYIQFASFRRGLTQGERRRVELTGVYSLHFVLHKYYTFFDNLIFTNTIV